MPHPTRRCPSGPSGTASSRPMLAHCCAEILRSHGAAYEGVRLLHPGTAMWDVCGEGPLDTSGRMAECSERIKAFPWKAMEAAVATSVG